MIFLLSLLILFKDVLEFFLLFFLLLLLDVIFFIEFVEFDWLSFCLNCLNFVRDDVIDILFFFILIEFCELDVKILCFNFLNFNNEDVIEMLFLFVFLLKNLLILGLGGGKLFGDLNILLDFFDLIFLLFKNLNLFLLEFLVMIESVVLFMYLYWLLLMDDLFFFF